MPFPGREPSHTEVLLNIVQGRVTIYQIRILKSLWTLISVSICDNFLERLSGPKIFIRSSIAPRIAERSITPMGTQVKLRDQLNMIVMRATVVITRTPPIIGVLSLPLRDSIEDSSVFGGFLI